MRRMTDKDRRFGPITWGPWNNSIAIVWQSGGEDEEEPQNSLRMTAFGWAVRIWLPNILRPWRVKHMALSWDEATVVRLGRNYYYESWSRQYGFSLCNMGNGYDFLQVFLGPQTHDSQTTKNWCTHLPWKQWDCVRHSIYTPTGEHFYTEPHWKIRRKLPDRAQFEFFERKEACPASYFGFEDFDDEMIVAICKIEEREWRKGIRWFSWLKYFARPMIRRDLDLEFTKEVGPEKGSWKGGTIGHSIDMLPGETPEDAFRRYCGTPHDARHGRKYGIRFIGTCPPPPPKEIRVAMARGWKECDYPHKAAKGMWYHPDSPLCQDGKYISTEEMLESIQSERREQNKQCAEGIKGS